MKFTEKRKKTKNKESSDEDDFCIVCLESYTRTAQLGVTSTLATTVNLSDFTSVDHKACSVVGMLSEFLC